MDDGLDDVNVKRLPVRFKGPMPEERSVVQLHEVGRSVECSHLFVQYLVCDSAAEVECGRCGAKLNPMWVLIRLASEDRRMEESQKRYQDELKRLEGRSRTKCRCCGKMTPISRT